MKKRNKKGKTGKNNKEKKEEKECGEKKKIQQGKDRKKGKG